MARGPSVLPLADDETGRFLPWLVSLMVFLSAMALAGVLVLSGLIGRWDGDISGTLTVQLAPVTDADGDAARILAQRVQAAEHLLAETPGIRSARALDRRQQLALIEPWLGDTELVRDLPLPALIDVAYDEDAGLDIGELATRLAEVVPGAVLDDHRLWLARLVDLGRAVEAAALVALAMIGFVTAATVVYATRTGMAVHHEIVEVLHLIGAHDRFIAQQFADRAFVLAVRGGIIGLLVAVPTLAAVNWAAGRLEGGFLVDLSLPAYGWPLVAALPVAAGLIARATARLTVRRAIGRLP